VAGRKKITMRTTTLELPDHSCAIHAKEIKAIREKLNVSQQVFAKLLNVPLVTEASWESGRRNPSGAAVRLLQIAKKQPKILMSC